MTTFIRFLLTTLTLLSLSNCLTRRTVSEGGVPISEQYIIKRPIKNALTHPTP